MIVYNWAIIIRTRLKSDYLAGYTFSEGRAFRRRCYPSISNPRTFGCLGNLNYYLQRSPELSGYPKLLALAV